MLPSVPREDELEYCEAFGRLFETTGATRIAGRLVGWLLICDPSEQTQAELVELLGVSKASVSTELRALEQLGLVERTTLPGDRRSYYRITVDAWPELMARRLRMIDRFVDLADRGLALLEHETSARRTRLAGLRHAYGHLQRAMLTALDELRGEAEASPKIRAHPRARKPEPTVPARARATKARAQPKSSPAPGKPKKASKR
jgi:DNA-binding transcriptional regulator GbsR (MarR family)